MGWFRDWLEARTELDELREQIASTTVSLRNAQHDVNLWRDRAHKYEADRTPQATHADLAAEEAENDALRVKLDRLEKDHERLAEGYQRLDVQHALVMDMLTDARNRELGLAVHHERMISAERHNAALVTAQEWALAHINMLATERGALLAERGVHVPVPALQATGTYGEAPAGAPAQPFDRTYPTAVRDHSVRGVPIPEGQTGGDVLARLRQQRDDEAALGNLSPQELLEQSAAIFEELPFPDASPSGPFTE